MPTRSEVVSRARDTRKPSPHTPNSSHVPRQHHSNGRSEPSSSGGRLGLAEHAYINPESASRLEPWHGHNSAWSRTSALVIDSISPELGSQFQPDTRKKYLTKNLERSTRWHSDQNSSTTTLVAASKSRNIARCTRCKRDGEPCDGQESASNKGSRKCRRCDDSNYACESPAEQAKSPRKTSASKSIAPRSASVPLPLNAQHDTRQHVAANPKTLHGFDCRGTSCAECTTHFVSMHEPQGSSISYESDLPWSTIMLTKPAIPYSPDQGQSRSFLSALLMRFEAMVKQKGQGPTAGHAASGGIRPTKGGSKSHSQRASNQLSDVNTEPNQDNSEGEEDERASGDAKGIPEGPKDSMLACPWASDREWLDNHPKHRRCREATLRDWHALVQHMKRTHHYCWICNRYFKDYRELEDYHSTSRHCNRCHEGFEDSAKLVEHKSKRCEKDRRSVRERWYAVWSNIFSGELRSARPTSCYAETSQDDCRLGELMRKQSRECRESIVRLLLANPNLSSRDRIIISALGSSMSTLDLPTSAGRQSGTNASGPTMNTAAMSSITGTSSSSMPSHQPSSYDHDSTWSWMDGSAPEMESQYSMPSVDNHNHGYSGTPLPSAQQSFSTPQHETHTSWAPRGQLDVQAQHFLQTQSRAHAYMQSPGQDSLARGNMLSDPGQQLDIDHQPDLRRYPNYFHQPGVPDELGYSNYPVPPNQHQQGQQSSFYMNSGYPFNPNFPVLPFEFFQLPQGSNQPNVRPDTGTVTDQCTSEDNQDFTQAYQPPNE